METEIEYIFTKIQLQHLCEHMGAFNTLGPIRLVRYIQ